MRTISYFYTDYRRVRSALAELESRGVAAQALTVIAEHADERYRLARSSDWITGVSGPIALAAAAGAVLGVLATGSHLDFPGHFSGLAAQSMPIGLAPTTVLPLLGALAGVALAALVRRLTGPQVPGGGTIITVRADDDSASEIDDILRLHSDGPYSPAQDAKPLLDFAERRVAPRYVRRPAGYGRHDLAAN